MQTANWYILISKLHIQIFGTTNFFLIVGQAIIFLYSYEYKIFFSPDEEAPKSHTAKNTKRSSTIGM